MSTDGKSPEPRQSASPARTPIQEMYRFLETSRNPLVDWLFSEAKRRGDDKQRVADSLKVTTGYLAQLQNGMRAAASISPDLARACARYLCVSPVVVMLVSGALSFDDFDVARWHAGAV
jgi:hypothetical protein